MDGRTHYDVLGVVHTASTAEIQTAYRAAARRLHPDAGGNAAAMQRLNEAWHVLRDHSRRAAYDSTLAHEVPTPGPEATARGPQRVDPEPESFDWDELDDDLLDTTPLGPMRSLEGWLALVPPAAFILAMVLFVGGLVFASPALLVFAGAAGLVALGLFILMPLLAMARAPRTPPRTPEP